MLKSTYCDVPSQIYLLIAGEISPSLTLRISLSVKSRLRGHDKYRPIKSDRDQVL